MCVIPNIQCFLLVPCGGQYALSSLARSDYSSGKQHSLVCSDSSSPPPPPSSSSSSSSSSTTSSTMVSRRLQLYWMVLKGTATSRYIHSHPNKQSVLVWFGSTGTLVRVSWKCECHEILAFNLLFQLSKSLMTGLQNKAELIRKAA